VPVLRDAHRLSAAAVLHKKQHYPDAAWTNRQLERCLRYRGSERAADLLLAAAVAGQRRRPT